MNTFSCKITLANYSKENGERMIYLQAIIDRIPVRIPLGFYLKPENFDKKHERVKSSNPNAQLLNKLFSDEKSKAHKYALQIRDKWQVITPELFRNEYKTPSDTLDFIGFIKQELEKRKTELASNTVKQHNTLINKLTDLQKIIRFAELSPDFIRRFKEEMNKTLQPISTSKLLKILKYYCERAEESGYKLNEPFRSIKIKDYKSNRTALTIKELNKLNAYYDSSDCKPNHKNVLRYFLFSCYSGVRISDIHLLTWDHLHDDNLIFVPEKTKNNNEQVNIPLTVELKYLPPKKTRKIFDPYTDQVSNRILKKIAALDRVDIKKKLTFHTSRHTAATLMSEVDLAAAKKMLGHGNIKTTMEYVHTSNESVRKAKLKAFPFDIPSKTSSNT